MNMMSGVHLAGPALCLSLGLLATGSSLATQASEQSSGAFFRVEQRDGRWWLIDPDKKLFLSKGVCHVVYAGDRIQGTNSSPYRDAVERKFGSIDAWRKAAGGRLIEWGFNTLGAWSDDRIARIDFDGRRLAYAPTIDLGAAFVARSGGDRAWLQGIFPDVFHPDFEGVVGGIARERCAPLKEDRALLGWFTDNELRWGPDWRSKDELLTTFLNLPRQAPGRVAALRLLRERHGAFEKFNAVWKTGLGSWDELESAPKVSPPYARRELYAQNQGEESAANQKDPLRAAFVADCEAFAGLLAERYFRITRDAIRAADPNHLVFGCRFAYVPSRPVTETASRFLDAISFNCYNTDPRPVIKQYAVFGRPLIIGEFTFRAQDSGMPNTRGAGPRVETQADRAAGFESYVRIALSEPEVVGYHWFQHSDQPKEGRFDGENSNYGVVNICDETYQTLTGTMKSVNGQAQSLHK